MMHTVLWTHLGCRRVPREPASFEARRCITLSAGDRRERRIRYTGAITAGIHGTPFYQLERYKKWHLENREDAVDPAAINPAQRRLYGVS